MNHQLLEQSKPKFILNRDWLLTSSFIGAMAVSTGAIGSHMLKEKLSDNDLNVWNTGVQFAFYHLPCLLLISLIQPQMQTRSQNYIINIAGWTFSIGIILFSGSLFILSISNVKPVGYITPIGGLLLLLGWFALASLTYNKKFLQIQ